jgi:hypothetical protein
MATQVARTRRALDLSPSLASSRPALGVFNLQ